MKKPFLVSILLLFFISSFSQNKPYNDIDKFRNFGYWYRIKIAPKTNKITTIITDLGYGLKQVSNDGQPVRTSDSTIIINGLMLSLGIIF